MKILVNNKEVETAAVSISALMEELSLPFQGVAVAVENRLVPRTSGRLCVDRGVRHCRYQAACGG